MEKQKPMLGSFKLLQARSVYVVAIKVGFMLDTLVFVLYVIYFTYMWII